MKVKEWLFLIIGLFGLPWLVFAKVEVAFSLQKDKVELGERVRGSIVVKGKNLSCSEVIFPSPQLFSQEIFVRKIGDCKRENGWVKQDYEIAVFSLHPKIDPVPVFINGKEYKTPRLQLKVKEYLPKDVSKVQPRDFAGLYFVPFPWGGFLLTIVVLALVVIVICTWLHKKKVEEERRTPPYWDIARERLDNLSKASLIELGKFRQFYYELTEILRYIIQKRFNIPAMEMTNSELIPSLRSLELEEETKERIKELIERSGPVKYAQGEISEEVCRKDLDLVMSLVEKIARENEVRDDNSSGHTRR